MINVYYLENSITFLTRSEYAGLSPGFRAGRDVARTMCNAEQLTKLDDFSGKSKRVLMVCDSEEQLRERFELFSANLIRVSAGGGLVSAPSGAVLMIFRNGKWDLPKGKLEKDEAIEDCALREVGEECSVEGISMGNFLCHTYHLYKFNDRLALKQTSWFSMEHSGEGKPIPQRVEGITKARWVPAEDIQPYIAGTYHTIREVFEAAGIY